MDKKVGGVFPSVLFGILFLLAGCGGSGGGSSDSGESLSSVESGSAADYDAADTVLSDAGDIVDEEAIYETGLQKGLFSSRPARMGCGTVTFDPATSTMTVDFGAEGCKGRHDRNRQGTIKVQFNGKYKEEGSVITITFSNYGMDGRQVEGTRTITNLGRNEAGLLLHHIVTEATITLTDGTIIEWLSERTREWTEGEETSERKDDIYTILEGVSHWTNSNDPGETFSSEITEPIVITIECKFKLRGMVLILHNGKVIVKVKYKVTCEPHEVEGDDDDDDGEDDPSNHAPVITPLPSQTDVEGETVSLPVEAMDSDDDALTFSAEGLPPDLTIDAATGVISGTLSCESAGDYVVIVTVSDGTESATDAFLGTVTEACDPPSNSPPEITNPGDQTSTEGEVISLQLVATDPDDGDVLAFSTEGLPPDVTMDAAGLIMGTLSCESAGSYVVSVTVSDGTESATDAFLWDVAEACDPSSNSPPEITNLGDQTSTEGYAVSLPVKATDPDNDVLTFSATGLPDGLTIDAATGVISGIPECESAGRYAVNVTVSDDLAEDTTSFTWTIQAGGCAVLL